MTALTDHCDNVRAWLNFEHSNAVITSWTRIAERSISETLRVREMVKTAEDILDDGCTTLPEDWEEMDFVKLVGGKPMRFVTREDFFSADREADNIGKYTLVGSKMHVGGKYSDDMVTVAISYYASVPALGEKPNWLTTKYSGLLLFGTLTAATMYTIEDDQATKWKSAAEQMIGAANESHTKSKTSGSLLSVSTKRKGFG